MGGWLDPFVLFFKNALQLPARPNVILGAGLEAEDDPEKDATVISVSGAGQLQTVIQLGYGDGDQLFNGDGSGGARQLFPLTIIQLDEIHDVDLIYTLSKETSTGIAAGWLVFVSILSSGDPTDNSGSLTIKNGDADSGRQLDGTGDGHKNNQTVILYFDGVDWERVIAPFAPVLT